MGWPTGRPEGGAAPLEPDALLLEVVVAERRLRILLFPSFQRTWITSAQTVLLWMSDFLMVVSGWVGGKGPASSLEVDQTFVRSSLTRLAQAFWRMPVVVLKRKYDLNALINDLLYIDDR